jgi:pimeloyl-ACP methyl ester carboxylesterase
MLLRTGFGLSSRPSFPSSRDGCAEENTFVEAIEAWRRQMQIEELSVCGHSFGAYLAASYAMQKASPCQSLLLIDPWGMPERDHNALKNTSWSRKLVIGAFWAISSLVEPVTLLQLSGSYSWFAKSRARMVTVTVIVTVRGTVMLGDFQPRPAASIERFIQLVCLVESAGGNNS